jgi:hypothetical protein
MIANLLAKVSILSEKNNIYANYFHFTPYISHHTSYILMSLTTYTDTGSA